MAVVAPSPGAQADAPSPLFTLIDAAAQRLQTAEQIAAVKWNTGGPIEDPSRVQQVLNSVTTAAAAQGVDPSRVRTVFENQIAATEAIQYARFAQWKLDPVAAPAEPPNLSVSRTLIDTINKTMVEQIARNWPLLNGPGCAAALDAARSSVVDMRHFDHLYQQAISFATHSYC